MSCRIAWSVAALLADGPQTANASRTPEKRAEKHPKPRKSKKPARSSGAASAAP